jgi:hypothetical protein
VWIVDCRNPVEWRSVKCERTIGGEEVDQVVELGREAM